MGMNNRERRFVAWIATFAILLASMVPTISHALAKAGLTGVAAWTLAPPVPQLEDVRCHATEPGEEAGDVHALHADESHSPATHSPGLHLEHCPFCFTHSGSFGLAPVMAGTVLPLATGTTVAPLLFYHSPRPLFVWLRAQPRAPPARS